MKPACSSARTRRRHGGAEMPTRRASSTLVMRPSPCSSFRIFQSMASRRADTGGLRVNRAKIADFGLLLARKRRARKNIARVVWLAGQEVCSSELRNLHGWAEPLHLEG